MKHINYSRFFYCFLSFTLLFGPLPVVAIGQEIATSMSYVELSSFGKQLENSYVYLGKDASSIEDIVSFLSDIDENPYSPILVLKKYIADGFFVAEYDAIERVVNYAQSFLQKNQHTLSSVETKAVTLELELFNNQMASGALFADVTEEDYCTIKDIVRSFTANIINVEADSSVWIQDLNVQTLSVIDQSITNTLTVNDVVVNNTIELQDAAGGEYVGLQAPSVVPTSYTLSFPSATPTVNQTLRSGPVTPTDLAWVTEGGAITPAVGKTIYVTKYGSDVTGDGSFDLPYASLAKAIELANTLASSLNPINISIAPGIYIEDNSISPLIVTAESISIVGDVSSGVIIVPNTPTNDCLWVNVPIHISDIAFQSFAPLAIGITLAAGNLTTLTNVDLMNFLIGVNCVGGPENSYGFMNCFFADNATAVLVNNAYVSLNSTTIFGTTVASGPSVNNAVTATGSGANLVINGGLIGLCQVGITITNNAITTVAASAFRLNVFDIEQNGASRSTFSGCTFELTTDSSDIDLHISDAGTIAEIISCEFSGSGVSGTPQGTAIFVADNASVNISGGSMHNYTTGIEIGTSSNSSSTSLFASSLVIKNCTADIVQQGSATIDFNASAATSSKITINDPTNVNLAFFDLDDNSALTIGSAADQDTVLVQADINSTLHPSINYKSSLYSAQAIGFENPFNNPSSWFILSSDNTDFTAITSDRTKTTGIRLASDEGSPVGGTSALRGWDINKNGSSAELAFNYQNSDSSGQVVIPEYTVMQLDGVNNQLQLPTAGTQIVFGGDTNLYRSTANVLKTDDNLIVGTLTPGRAISTDATTNQLISSTATTTELNYLSGVTSPIQGQLNNKVSRSGDSMTGALSMLTQNAVQFKDPFGQYVGINAPSLVPSSYTVSLPSTVPVAHQIMRANSATPTNLEWITSGGSVAPANSKTVYVAKFGNDITGDGSFDSPYASLSKAINVANLLATAANPICITVEPGIYIENNSTGPLTVTATGISIIGNSTTAVVIMPSTPANDLLLANTTIRFADLSLQSSSPLAAGLTLTAGNLSTCNSVRFVNFATGVLCSGGTTQLYGFNACIFIANTIGLSVNDSRVQAVGNSFFGTPSVTNPPVNTGISMTGAGANVIIDGGAIGKCNIGFSVNNNSTITIAATSFKLNTFDIIQTGASHMVLNGASFELTNGSSDVDIQISDPGTIAEIVGCQFNGNNALGVPEGQCIRVSNNAYLDISSGSMKNYATALQIGISTDTASTIASVSGFTINNCTIDIQQEGSATLNFNAGTSSNDKIIINDPTNVKLAYFDLSSNNQLTIGSNTDINTGLIAVNIDSVNPGIDYLSSLYSTQAIGFNNPLFNPSSFFVLSQNSADFTAITTNRSDSAGLRLLSDTGSPVGGTSALRGWDVNKNGSSAELSFNYQNSDSSGQVAIPEYTVMQLDGVNNQLQLPTAGTQVVFGGDTNLYRNSANVLKTDDNLIVGTLTPGRAVTTDATTNELISSATTTTELNYLSGVTSPVQAQIDGKVAKTGDSMSGALNMLAQNAVQFQDASGGEFIGINAPAVVPTSYTVSLPSTVPVANQILGTNSITPTNLEWITSGASVIPANSKTIYVTKYGNDITGNGSFTSPYASLAKAIDVANSIALNVNPVAILVKSGIYVENNSAGPLTVTATGVSIVGDASNSVVIVPNTPTNNLLLINTPIQIINMTFQSSSPLATGITIFSNNLSVLENVYIYNFLVGIDGIGGLSNSSYGFNNCLFIGNGTSLLINDAHAECNDCTFFGTPSLSGPPANTGVVVTGSLSNAIISGGVVGVCTTGLSVTSNALCTVSGVSFRLNNFDVIQNNGSQMTYSGCTFELASDPSDMKIQIDGPGTFGDIVSCSFNGKNSLGVPEGIGIAVTNNAFVGIVSSIISDYVIGMWIGLSTDTSSTTASVASCKIRSCTTDIIQEGSATLDFNAGTASSSKISVNDPTNVKLAYFDLEENDALTIGSAANVDTSLIRLAIPGVLQPSINYISSLYSSQAVGFSNEMNNPGTLYALSQENTSLAAITGDRTKIAALRLVSDTGSLVGGTSALRGWDINKNSSSAELSFNYQNSDSSGQIAISEYTVMQLDGVNNQLQLPAVGTRIVFDTDTNLYRDSANVLKTDDNLIVGGLTPDRAVVTAAGTNQLASSVVTGTEIGYLSGVTSSIQTQFNGKVAKAGDTMTGTLQLPAGTTALPSLVFTGSTTSGLSTNSSNLSFSTNALERMKVSSGGTISINAFGTAGVVHNDSSGNLLSSLIVNADIDPAAAIVDTKLATISTAGKVANSATTATNISTPNSIVARDGSGNFSAGTITANLNGNATTATTATNFSGLLSGDVTGTQSATVVSFVGGKSATNVADSVDLTNAATSSDVANAIVRRNGSGDFSTNAISVVDEVISNSLTLTPFTTSGIIHNNSAGLLSSSLIVNADIDPAAAIVDTKLATISTAGKVANSATTATNINTINTIVARDGSGNFAAGTITANLTGNATTATTATNFSGSLLGDVTGTQGATVVSLVGGQTASNVAAATVLANAATSANTANTIVLRDASGNFSASIVSVTDEIISNTLTITPFNSVGVVHNNASGLLSTSLIVNADVSPSAAIVDTKLATISTPGKVANSSTTATSVNTPSTIVLRDASGNFSANSVSLNDAAIQNLTVSGCLASLCVTALSAGDESISGTLSVNDEVLNGELQLTAFTSAGVVHNDSTGLLSTSLIVNADIDAAANIADTKLATISTAGKVANSATTATNANTASAIVARDASGNFSAGTITANLIGNATTATTAINFTGSLLGDVTGTQGATVVSTVGGQTATNIAAATVLANAATDANNANTIVRRNASGNFSAGAISVTDEVVGNSLTVVPFNSAGVVHNDSTGLLSSSLIVDADITNATISNAKLATISSANNAGSIVVRDGSGNFATNMITLNGTVTNPTDAATKSYVDTAISLGLVAKTPALVVGTSNIALTGLQIIDGILLFANNRVLLINQTNPIENGLWLAESGSWIRPADFASGSTAGQAYVLITAGVVNAGSSYLCSTPTAIVDTDPIQFSLFSLPDTTTAANVGTGTGLIYQSKTGVTLNFRSLLAGTHIDIATNANDITFTTDATDANSASSIVARDASGNFSAGTITANLTGNATTATTATSFSGSLLGDVTGTQGATVVSFVGGQTASNIAAATVLANAATSANTANTIVLRDASGNFSAGAVSITDEIISNTLTIAPFNSLGIVHNDASGLLSSSLLVNADVDPAAAIVDTKLATISTVGKVSNSATTATNINTANAIVARDASGNFVAGTITASLTGAASLNVLKAGDTMTGSLQLPAGTTASPSLKFTGSTTSGLSTNSGDLSFSTSALERMQISAGGTVSINAFGTAGVVHNDASGNLSSSLIVNADVDPAAAIVDTKLATISTAGKVSNSATTATSTNTANTIVLRDVSGNFSAGTITANLSGNATTATTATNFTGSFAGDVTGTQGATVVSFVGGQSASNVAAATVLANAATDANTASTIVKRTSTGGFSAGAISVTDEVVSNSLIITPFNSFGVVHNNSTGLLSSSLIVNADVDPAAAIVDTKLATISTAGKVANSATTATNANTASAIVARDASGNFSAGTITASLTGSASNNVLKAGDTMTGVLQLPAGSTGSPALIFTGSTNAGLSASAGNLSFSTAALERMKISSSGTVSINAFVTAGIVHNDASGNLSSSLIVNADIDPAAAIVDTKLATISTAGKVSNSATTATSTNSASAIVARDASGNFSAGIITANLTGNATTATTATNFSGSLVGDVTGTQGATVVSAVGGQTAANVAAATILANAATSNNTPSTLVARDASGNFSAGAISLTDEVISNSLIITPFNSSGIVHNSATGLLSSSLIVNADIAPAAAIADTKLATISTAGKVSNSATTATNANAANAIVARDASGNFSAGIITANLTGNATTATTATNFSGSLVGDVTGTQGATVVSFVGGQPAANVAAATILANAATSTNAVSAIVRRDASGNFSTSGISVIDEVVSNSLTVMPFNTAGVVHNNASGLLSSSLIVDGDITDATISNAKLATISSSNTSGNIVVRDGSGNFATNMITLNGSVVNSTDAATKAYVDSAISTGISAKTPAVVVSLSNETLSGYPTIDGVTFPNGTNRILLTEQTNPVENGLWVAAAGAWSRPTDFASGATAGQAYVLILLGTTEAGSAWLCSTPTAIINTDPIHFSLFTLPDTTSGANVGTGTGLVFKNKTGSTLNFRSFIADTHIAITNNADDITIGTDATSANTASTIVARDASGNFSAGTIIANLTGNATTATTATSFSGSLLGDVTGTQSATVVSLVGGQSASNVAAATVLANAATSANTASAIVKRTSTGGFSAGAISVTDGAISSSLTIAPFNTAGVVHNNSAGLLSTSLIVNADVDPAAAIVDTKLATISTAGKVANSATTATNANTASAIVARDASGNFSAGTITANLTGNATTATTATSFSGSLLGDVTGTQGATVVSLVGGQSASNVAAATALANAATSANTASAIVKRTSTGGFSAGVISVTDEVISNSLVITPFNSLGIVHNSAAGLLSTSLIVNADVDPAAAIVDTKLATISTAGKVANSATTATNANTASAIVARDASGNFSAGTITASLTGAASLNVLKAGDTMTGALQLPAGTAAAPTIRFTGSTTSGLSAPAANTLALSTAGVQRIGISAAGAITLNTLSTLGVVHNSAAGLLTTSLIVNADVDPAAAIVDTKLATISTAGKVANSATTATNANTASAIVARDASGNFSAGTITANLTGNATTATTATSFSGSLLGDVTGTQSATVVSLVGGQSASSVAAATVLANAATSANTASAIVKRTSTGGFSAGAISVTDEIISNTLTVVPFNSAGVVHNDTSGLLSTSLIVNADVDPAAAIVDTKLATIATAGKVSNSATTATSANTASAIVARDASGNFAAGTITASITGAASLNVLKAGDTMTGTLTMPAGTAGAPSIQFTDSTNTGLSAATINTLSFDTNGVERMNINPTGDVTINGLSSLGIVHNSAAGLLSTSLIVNADVDPAAAIIDTKLATISTAGKVANSATTATNANTASAIVARDASGNFSAGTITANLTGNATTATTATSFSGSLLGDVTGTQSATVVSLVGGQSASSVAAATVLANAATSANSASAIVKRTSTGGFSAGAISVTDEVVSNSLTVVPFNSAGVIHNDSTGLFSSSLIVDADITNATISNAKLATISSANNAGSIVVRDGSGNFATNMITLSGTVANPTDAATKAYVDAAISTGLVAKTPALVVSTSNVALTGLQTIDSVLLSVNNRVLLINQTNPIENGLWLAQSGAWIRPADFASGTTAGQAYVLITSGAINAGSSYLCNTPAAIIDTDPIGFSLFALPDTTTAANVGTGTGLVYQSKTGVTLNFRSLLAGTHINVATNANDITFTTDATDANSASTIVARDASGNFSAGTITANLTGNATTATTATSFSGSLLGDVTGTQGATIVSLVGGQSASNVAAATALANAATSTNTASTIVKRTSTGGFSAGAISVTDEAISSSLTIAPFNTAGVVHNNSAGLLSTSLIVNADVDPAAAIIDTKLATISTGGKVSNSATTATNANTASAIVARDASGNFSAGTITASLTGSASNNVLKAGDTMTGTLVHPAGTVAAPSIQFTGSTNTGLSAPAANALALSTNSAQRLGISSAGAVTINNLSTLGVVHNSAAGLLTTSLIVNADVDPAAAIVDTKLATISTAGKVANSATTATNANTASAIVARDASGNFSAGTITANLTGNATTATTATSFSGSLLGDVTGTQSATVVSFVGGQSASNVAAATALANAATSANTASTIVKRTSTGGFSAGAISVTDEAISSSLTIAPFNTAGVVHNSSAGLLSTSLIVNADVDPTAAIVDTKLATISSAGKVANSATTATALNNPNTIVLRDGSGNFAAGTITASITGAASLNVLKAGDTMTGALQLPAGTTTLPSLVFTGSTTTGLSASAGALSLSTAATERMKIDSGGTISINAFTSAGVVHNDSSGNLSSSLIVNADIDPAAAIVDTKLATISTAGKVANSATTATSSNAASTIVARDASGNFSAGTITANLTGNATTATTATSFSGSLLGDVTGTQSATVVSLVGGQSASNVAAATALANAATSANTASTIVKRTSTGGFSAGAISVTDEAISSSLTIAPFNTAGVVHNSSAGLLSTSLIVNADVDPAAAIVDTKLATISTAGKVSNSATTATSNNTASAIVARDASGNFSAGTITASLTGSASNNVLKAGDTMTGTLQLPAGTTVLPSLVFTGSTTTGLSANSGALSFSTSSLERMKIASGGAISINAFTSAGVVHNDASGNLSSSLITNADIIAGAGIVDTKLATISTAGKVANSATTATNANTASTIVARDASGNFSAGTITANLIGNVTGNITGSASLNVLKAGDTMTGSLIMPAGTAAAPSIQFTGSTNTGFSAATANTLSFDTNGAERMNISPTGNVTINVLNTLGVVHNSAAGLLSTSLIVNADIDPAAAIVDTKLATISTAGKVSNSATTATSNNTASAIIARDASGNFSAGTITASLTGSASNNVLKAGDTMTGTLQLPAGTTALPSLVFTGSTTTGLSTNTGDLSFSTNALERMKIASGGSISINAFTSAGIVHNDASGNLSSSLITNADIIAGAGIVDTKLATISTAGKVANSATTATNANSANAIVARDASGNFSAGTITANLIGNVTGNITGSASLNVLKAGDTMTGTLTHPAGTAAAPSIQFTGSTNTGFSAATANTLSFDTNGVERMNINPTGNVTINALNTLGVVHNSAAGLLSTSLIVDADIAAGANITDSKLATITTAGKVSNSATTATSANTASAIVARDASGNFSAGTITASLAGSASNNVLKAGDTMTGTLQLPAGTTALPSLVFTGSTTTGLSSNSGDLSFSSSAIERMKIASGGAISINAFTSAGVVHNDASGNLSSSLITNADIIAGAGIVDTKLATISTAGKVANSATTATNANTASAIVARDSSGNFITNMITLNGTVTNPTDAATKAYVDAQSGGGGTGTNLNTPNALVQRDGTGSFAAQVVSVVDVVASGNLNLSTNPSSSTTGNIMKGSSSFIHNKGTNNTFVGISAGNFTTSGNGCNSALGSGALTGITSGYYNTAVGYQALAATTNAFNNTGMGYQAMAANTQGYENTAIGFQALMATTTGFSNVAIGSKSLSSNITGYDNTGIGYQALGSNTMGFSNTGVGYQALFSNTSGYDNSAFGFQALYNNGIGYQNVALGYQSLSANTTGFDNSAVGFNSLSANTTGTNNVAFGFNALNQVTTGSNNIAIGSTAGSTLTIGSGNIYINANAAVNNEANTIRIGTSQTSCYIQGINTVTLGNGNSTAMRVSNTTGQLGMQASSRRFKHNIVDMEDISTNIYQLRPVNFVYNGDATNETQYGLIAEEVNEVLPAIVSRDNEGLPFSVNYEILPVLIVKEMQKQQITIEELRSDNMQLKEIVQNLISRIKSLEAKA